MSYYNQITKQGDHRMKTRYIFIALLTLTLGAHASFYNQTTQIEAGKLPKIVYTDTGYINQPTTDQLKAAGWVIAPIIPFTLPEGYQKIAGTRRIVVAGKIASEMWDIETDADADARKIAQAHASQNAKSQSLKNREKKAKDTLIGLGLPVPVPVDSGDAMIDALSAQIDALLAEDKIKESADLTKKVISAMFLFQMLGDDIYSPFLGEGRVAE